MAVKALTVKNFTRRDYYYSVIINYDIKNGNDGKAVFFIEQMIAEPNTLIHPDLYKTVKNHIPRGVQRKILGKMLSASEETDKSYGVAAVGCAEQKEFAKAAYYFNMAEQMRTAFPNEETNRLYRTIVKKLIARGIKVICMQYPMRSVNSVKNILRNEPYYNKITFVSNEEQFKKILYEKNYGALFVDQFAGDFGHCTDYGNVLIAEMLADNLLELTR
jgi:hypothetical protein